MSTIGLVDPDVGDAELERVRDTLASGQLADGPVVREFEDEFAAASGTDHAVATANGTAALQAALRAVGVGAGDAVVTTPFSFVATANAIRLCGATPVFADVDPDTYALDPASTRAAVEGRDDVVAILAVHLYGLPADVHDLRRIADANDLALVEDAAQAHGATVDGQPVGSLGDAGCFSFYPTKNMTTGEGGMVTTDDSTVADRVARFVNHGRADSDDRGYEHVEVGHNLRMTSIAAAIGLAQLEKLGAYTDARRINAAQLTDRLADVDGVVTPVEPPDRKHVYHQYTIQCADRDGLQETLAARDVESGVYYPRPIHAQPAYEGFDPDVPTAEWLAERVLSLPVHPGLTAADVRTVATAVEEHVAEVSL